MVAGQARENSELIAGLFTGSHCFVLVCEGNEIIGMGRAISDGISDAYIQDVTVLSNSGDRESEPASCRRSQASCGPDGLQWIGLIADGYSHPFYRKWGLKRSPAAQGHAQMLMSTGS